MKNSQVPKFPSSQFRKLKFRLPFLTLLLFINFIFTACDANKDLIIESVDRSSGYITKAHLNELTNKIENRDLRLIELIKNNPISMFKTASYQKNKTSSSEYYFDTDNIMALKNETNQAVYIIPVYKSSNARDNNIYSISINITNDFIDTKLNIVQLKEDGTQKYFSRDFEPSKKTSKTSKTTTEFECYCTIYVSDCTCHTSHAIGGCDHPEIAMYCSDCSSIGSSGGSGFGTNTGTSTGANTVSSTIWSGGGSNYGYTFNYTGQQAYISLMKIYQPDYTFTSLQKFNITNSPDISNVLLDFLNTDGKSQMNKDFVVSIFDAIEEGTVTSQAQCLVLLNAYKTVKVTLQIENQIDDSLLDPCGKGVFQQVKNSKVCDIAQVLTKLDAKKKIYTTTIKSEVAPSGAPAQTVWSSPCNYTIYISTNYTGKTKLFIAASIFHEIVHAYFMSLYDDYYNANPTNPNAYNDFSYLFHYYVTLKHPKSIDPADIQHQQMATDYVDAIARALQEYQTGIPVPIGTSPDQIYSDLAWGTLNKTPVFDAKYPVGNPDRQRIINRAACEQNGTTIDAGTPNAQTPIGNPCN